MWSSWSPPLERSKLLSISYAGEIIVLIKVSAITFYVHINLGEKVSVLQNHTLWDACPLWGKIMFWGITLLLIFLFGSTVYSNVTLLTNAIFFICHHLFKKCWLFMFWYRECYVLLKDTMAGKLNTCPFKLWFLILSSNSHIMTLSPSLHIPFFYAFVCHHFDL